MLRDDFLFAFLKALVTLLVGSFIRRSPMWYVGMECFLSVPPHKVQEFPCCRVIWFQEVFSCFLLVVRQSDFISLGVSFTFKHCFSLRSIIVHPSVLSSLA